MFLAFRKYEKLSFKQNGGEILCMIILQNSRDCGNNKFFREQVVFFTNSLRKKTIISRNELRKTKNQLRKSNLITTIDR
jgi:hypothetical protein